MNLVTLAPGLTIPELKLRLRAAFEKVYGMPSAEIRESMLDAASIEQTRKRNASWEWTYGKTLEFTLSFGKRFPWGEIELQLEIEKGIIADVKVYSDALDSFLAPKLELALAEKRVSQSVLLDAVQSIDAEQTVRDDICALICEQKL